MKTILSVFFILLFNSVLFANDIVDDISNAIRSGNAAAISKYFDDNVDLKVIDKENVYSKAQAELILKDFFAKNTPKSFTVLHKGVSKNGAEYIIGTVETSNKKYRSYFLLKRVNEKTYIQQLRFEPESK